MCTVDWPFFTFASRVYVHLFFFFTEMPFILFMVEMTEKHMWLSGTHARWNSSAHAFEPPANKSEFDLFFFFFFKSFFLLKATDPVFYFSTLSANKFGFPSFLFFFTFVFSFKSNCFSFLFLFSFFSFKSTFQELYLLFFY